jgi:hypothetical protein
LLIQNKKIPNERIGYRDQKGTFNMMIDENQRKIICQLRFTATAMKILIPSGEFIKEYPITNIDEIIKYKNEITDRTLSLLD